MLISITEAAKILGISRATAYRLAREGRLPCVRSLGPVRIHLDLLRLQIQEEAESSLRPQTEVIASYQKISALPKRTTAQLEKELDDLLSVASFKKQKAKAAPRAGRPPRELTACGRRNR